ncbi:hypothetical protein BTZ20_4466 [Rhodococcus sp. MTM3W5.2]|uniref:hypothetical protein n=1 Tax=Rhodococcus sp. MTM3W5.2 TaxID=1805827 RepID=UPI000979850A|nr:hypothetical protein [Rhodococcus sp. MTM3W5.2]AQA25640.1 hypothetical protein BTZ20_4466 [Rhodococcus sp. MTM3W5.2]
MATFIVNGEYSDRREVQADHFIEKGSFVVFSGSAKEQVFAMPTGRVQTIELKTTPRGIVEGSHLVCGPFARPGGR